MRGGHGPARVLPFSASRRKKKRRRRRRRKKRTPWTSSHSTLGHARRRMRQWHVPRWFPGFGASHAVFPSLFRWPERPGVMAGMDQKDSNVANSLQGRRHPVVTQRQILMVQTVQQTLEIPQLQFVARCSLSACQVLVVPVPFRTCSSSSSTTGAAVQTVQATVWRCRCCSISTFLSTPLLWRRGNSHGLA